MAKFCGMIGFATTVEDENNPGIWSEKIVEKRYSGDVIRNKRRLQPTSDSTNDNIAISNEISIVADPYANQNMYAIRYAEFKGIKWKVETVEVEYPRLILSMGGVWNG